MRGELKWLFSALQGSLRRRGPRLSWHRLLPDKTNTRAGNEPWVCAFTVAAVAEAAVLTLWPLLGSLRQILGIKDSRV